MTTSLRMDGVPHLDWIACSRYVRSAQESFRRGLSRKERRGIEHRLLPS
ncbi:hypothetical protein [Schlesneria sp.]